MLPSQTQRILMLLAVVATLPGWWWATKQLQPADGLAGWAVSNLFTRESPAPVAIAALAAALAGAALAGALVAAAGNPLAGVCCGLVSAAVCAWGVGFLGVAQRAGLPVGSAGVYVRLALEIGACFLVLTTGLAWLQWAGPRLRPRLPARLRSQHVGTALELWKVDGKSVAAGLVTAAVGAVLSVGLLRSTNPGQVVGGLFVAFTIASIVGHAVSPGHKPWAVLMAPGLVGLAGYGWSWWNLRHREPTALLADLYAGALPGAGLGIALPIHYATAGVIGCTLGLGIGLVVDKAKVGEL